MRSPGEIPRDGSQSAANYFDDESRAQCSAAVDVDEFSSSRLEEAIMDGDAVNAATIDVDDLAETRCTQAATVVYSRDRHFPDCASLVSDDYDVEDAFEDEVMSDGKVDVESTHNPFVRAASSTSSVHSEPSEHEESSRSTRSNDSLLMEPGPLPPSNPRPPSAPGAFPVTPRNTVDVDGDDETIGTIQIGDATNTSLEPHERPPREDVLVHATLVENGDAADPSLSRPNPVNQEEWTNRGAVIEARPLEYPQRTFHESIRNKWTQCNILLVIGLIAIAVALGVIALQPPAESQISDIQTIPNASEYWVTISTTTSVASIDTQDNATMLGQDDAFETNQPKGSSPQDIVTPLSRGEVYGLLPEYTKQALKWAGSPQYQAFEFVWRDPGLASFTLDRVMQRFAIMTVLIAIGYVNLRTLREEQIYSGRNECNWTSSLRSERVLLCNDDGQFIGIFLSNSDLHGTLVEELSMLSTLENIDLHANNITGSLPTTIGQLPRLKTLDLSTNALTGTLPYSLSSMAELEVLDLSRNKFMSDLPGELGYMTSLARLSLAENAFSGQIPRFFRHLTLLNELMLDKNELSGPLPASLGELVSLRTISLSSNRLTGTIPTSIGLLTDLRKFDVSDNLLSGTVPYALGSLIYARTFAFQDNRLSGFLPIEVCSLQENFDLEEITVDCKEIECWCSCNCSEDGPAMAVTKTP